MKILVTGSKGFIGSHLCQYFFSKKHVVTGWDISPDEKLWSAYQVDMTSEDEVAIRLEADKPEIIIHCAGNADVGRSLRNPSADFFGNVVITHNLYFALLKIQLKPRVVFLSSAAVYGNPTELPIREDSPLSPISPYALHKVMCEDICRYFKENHGIDSKICRIFSAYGEGLKKQIFWDMYNKTKLTGKLSMFGTGKESRDYIHVGDLVRAVYLIATQAPSDELIYNIGNGEEVSICRVTEYFANTAGVSPDNILFSGESQQGAPINWRADISKLTELGYKKTVGLEEGIQRYATWAKQY